MLLKVGSQGEDVKKLQTKLGLGADGIFGAGTEKAVKDWQAKNGLTADGIVGDGTWNKMFEASAATPVNPQITDAVTSKSNFKLDKLNIEDFSADSEIPDTLFPLAFSIIDSHAPLNPVCPVIR